MAESLKDKTVIGVGWSAADAVLGKGVTFIVGLVLARILSPAEYGLVGIVTIFTTVLTGIVDSGFSNALIRKTDVSDEDYNTMFITNLMISLVLYVALFFGATGIARFFDKIELTALTRVLGSILIIQAFSLVQNTILTKRIDFKTKTKASVFSAVISGIVGISMAVLGCGVWSLVGQLLTKQILNTVCLWILNHWWPKLRFSIQSFKYMWGFGWKLMLSGLLNNIWAQLYQVVVGKFYSPATLGQYSRSKEYANLLYELRKKKGMSPEEAQLKAKDPLYLGCLMIKAGDADGELAGARGTTADTIRPAFQILKTKPGCGIVSGAFLMFTPAKELGEDGFLVFADCAVNPCPTADELAQIAVSTAETARTLGQIEPRVAMLSFSTKGSAKHEVVDKVVEATRLAKERCPELKVDGELQADAALVPSVGEKKAPGSTIAGHANVLVYPNLEVGNISYKLVQRLAGAIAIGPILQGIARPVNDLSRGCSVDDIYYLIAITACQAMDAK